jgi:hypothetical protein
MLVALYCFLNYIHFFKTSQDKDVDLLSILLLTEDCKDVHTQDKDVDLLSILLLIEDCKDIDITHRLSIRNLRSPSPIQGFMCLVSEKIYPV